MLSLKKEKPTPAATEVGKKEEIDYLFTFNFKRNFNAWQEY